METLQQKSKMLLQYLFGQTLVYTGHMLIKCILTKLTDKVGNESLILLCLGEPLERGAHGIFNYH